MKNSVVCMVNDKLTCIVFVGLKVQKKCSDEKEGVKK